MSLIPNTKTGDCSRCTNKNTAVKKRGKLLLCTFCCRRDDVAKQLKKQRERAQVKSLTTTDWRQKVSENDDKVLKEKWFRLIREKLTGTCQCGCGNKSQKKDDMYFRHSCCHIFPKSKFDSIKYHPLNYVERAFWGGCHGVMDDTSMDKWVNMADWDDIKEKFYELAPLLTDEERATKFYTHLEKLIYQQ